MKKSNITCLMNELPSDMILEADPERVKKNVLKKRSKRYVFITTFIFILGMLIYEQVYTTDNQLKVYAAQAFCENSKECIEIKKEWVIVGEYSPIMSSTPTLELALEYPQKNVSYSVSIEGNGVLQKYRVEKNDEWNVTDEASTLTYDWEEDIFLNCNLDNEDIINVNIRVIRDGKKIEEKNIEVTYENGKYIAKII